MAMAPTRSFLSMGHSYSRSKASAVERIIGCISGLAKPSARFFCAYNGRRMPLIVQPV